MSSSDKTSSKDFVSPLKQWQNNRVWKWSLISVERTSCALSLGGDVVFANCLIFDMKSFPGNAGNSYAMLAVIFDLSSANIIISVNVSSSAG